jgi:hypothetical protein
MMTKSAAHGLLAALALALAPASLPAAPAAPAPDQDKASSPAEKLRQALNAPVTVKVEKQSLTAAVEMLREKGQVNLVLDTFSIQQLGWLPDQPPTPVDVDLKDVKFKSALRTILEPYNLSYAVVGDTVVVTTEQAAVSRVMRQRVNVEFDKVEFAQALKQLSKDTGANLLLDSRVEKEAKSAVSLELDDVPLETAVRLLSEMAGLKPVRIGNVLFITDKKNAAELRADPDLAQPTQPGQPGPIYGLDARTGALIFTPGGPAFGPGLAPAPPATGSAPVAPVAPPVTRTGDDDKPKSDAAPEKKDGDK